MCYKLAFSKRLSGINLKQAQARERQRKRQRQRETETERQRQRQRQRETEREREREGERERGKGWHDKESFLKNNFFSNSACKVSKFVEIFSTSKSLSKKMASH